MVTTMWSLYPTQAVRLASAPVILTSRPSIVRAIWAPSLTFSSIAVRCFHSRTVADPSSSVMNFLTSCSVSASEKAF